MLDRSHLRFRRLQNAANRDRCHLTIALGKRYCRRYPTHAPAWVFLGRAYGAAARYADARVAFSRALELAQPNRHALIFAQLGHLEALAGDFPAAESWYRKADAAAAPNAAERLYLGEILFKQGKLHEAAAHLRKIVSIENEALSEAWHMLGEVLASLEQYAESLACFNRAAERAPSERKHARRVRELAKLTRHFA